MSNTKKLEDLPVEHLLHVLKTRAGKSEKKNSGVKIQSGLDDLDEFDNPTIAKTLKAKQKAIYGADDRVDIFQLPAGLNKDDADCVVSLFQSGDVIDNGDGTSTLNTVQFGISQNLCSTEKFIHQPVGAFGSGFLVAPDIIATAGHCADESDVTDIRFVFGFRMKNANTAITTIANTEIYKGVSIIARKFTAAATDWALVRLDRPVTNHRIAPIRRSGKIGDTQAVHVIGHPAGLPAKFADKAKVRTNTNPAFFIANLDTFGGNSGSPVFNSTTHEVEGVLVRGEVDFVAQGTCNVSLVCPTSGCSGEDCTRTTEFAKHVPITNIWPKGKVYFFKGANYSRYDLAADKVESGWPKTIAGNWNGFPSNFASGINAYLMSTNGKVYFFKGSEYLRYDILTDKVDAGWPKSISSHWNGFPAAFASGVDAAVMWTGGKAYFFKGNQYLRYDMTTDSVDAGWPKQISGNWKGFPNSFNNGINGAILLNNGKAYFFKGSEYVRYDVAADKVDAGWPKSISANWPGLFTSDIDA